MGISVYLQNQDLTYNIKKYVADTPEDVPLLPKDCAPGSSAFVIDPPQKYMLNTKKEWILIETYNQSGGGGDSGITITKMYINEELHLICELSNGTTIDAGPVPTTGDITLINGGNANTIYT